eukprot:TRINITY_DN230_c0_g1_i1.p1 TRINITY_DN230_c0_g1~~TRINITY_DN230_c0_g1_i1.p1  ORF type:complete len:585 (-),score=22.49 TRINITY_DN230_c0_g1_i1:183-1937(-)
MLVLHILTGMIFKLFGFKVEHTSDINSSSESTSTIDDKAINTTTIGSNPSTSSSTPVSSASVLASIPTSNSRSNYDIEPIRLTPDLCKVLHAIQDFSQERFRFNSTQENPLKFAKLAMQQCEFEVALQALQYYKCDCGSVRAYKNQDQDAQLYSNIQLCSKQKQSCDAVTMEKYVNALKVRKDEEEYGWYNYTQMAKEAEKSIRLEHADYTKMVKIEAADDEKRYRCISNYNVYPGTLLLAEKAIAYIPREDQHIPKSYQKRKSKWYYYHRLLAVYLDELVKYSPTAKAHIYDLHKGGNVLHEFIKQNYDALIQELQTDEAVNMLAVVLATHMRHRPGPFASPTRSPKNGLGIWKHVAHMNHGCIGNVNIHNIGDFAFVFATKLITKGTELTFSYRPQLPYPQNVMDLKNFFVCTCVDCKPLESNETLKETRILQFKQARSLLGRFNRCIQNNKYSTDTMELTQLVNEMNMWLQLSRITTPWINPLLADILVAQADLTAYVGSRLNWDTNIVARMCVDLLNEAVQVLHINNNERCVEIARKLCLLYQGFKCLPQLEYYFFEDKLIYLCSVYIGDGLEYAAYLLS